MMQHRYYSDEELVAYLDGETEFAPVDEIASALKRDAALAKRVEALRIDTKLISENFSSLLPKDRRLPDLPTAPETQNSFTKWVAAVACALVIGFGAGYLSLDTKANGWKDYVAAYQALYTNSTLAHVNNTNTVKQNELTRVASAIGKQIDVGKLKISPEIDYKRAQILGFKGKALIQLAFLTSTGEPMALCIIRSSNENSGQMQLATLEGMSSAYWSRGGYEYLLIGGSDQPLVSRLALAFDKNSL